MNEAFKKDVYRLVESIPRGRFMTYGQIAALCGNPTWAWQVGQIAHFGPEGLPWHRVVNKMGGLARGWPNGGVEGHKALIEAEGVEVNDFKVDIGKLIWSPENER